MIKKIFLTILSLITIFSLNLLIVTANENNNTNIDIQELHSYQNLLGVRRMPNDKEKIIETLDDMNYTLDNIELKTTSNFLSIKTNINNENLQFDTILYPSQVGNNTENRMIGIINNNNNDKYDILKLTIEKNADESTLLIPNMYLYGKTVVSFAVYNKMSLEEYYVQFAIDDYDFDTIYNIGTLYLNQNNVDKDELFNIEVAYFTLNPKKDFINTFNSIEEMEFGNSTSVSVYNQFGKDENIIQDLEGKFIDQIIDISKEEPIDLSQTTYSLIQDIPDYLYKTQVNGKWTNGDTGYDSRGNLVGYTIYHMNDSYSGNVLNYVLRYYCANRINWNSNEFETSFNLSHNIWVEYIKNSNSVYIFDDRASNARILIDPTIKMSVNTNKDKSGYFVSRMTNAHKNGSKAKNIAEIVIGYVPYISDIYKSYQTFTKGTSVGNNSKIWFESNYTKEVNAKIDNLKYAPNGRGYSQDFIGITVYGNGVNSLNYGYSFNCRTR
ncbi:MAG: hypothetical protein ACLUCH_07220 [Lachnospirales bacterium]